MPYSSAPRALIADDQPEVLEALRLLLKGEGYLPVTVTSPDAVIQQLMSQPFDVLLMDLNYARDTTSGQEGLARPENFSGKSWEPSPITAAANSRTAPPFW